MTQPEDNVATIEEYSDVWEFRDRARQMAEWGWHPLSVSTTLARTPLTYMLLGLGPRDARYHVLYVRQDR